MTTQSIKPGDIVKCDIRGQVFYAHVVSKGDRLDIEPLDKRVTFRNVTARQVVGHYRKAKGSK
jgi:hypothetical protein